MYCDSTGILDNFIITVPLVYRFGKRDDFRNLIPFVEYSRDSPLIFLPSRIIATLSLLYDDRDIRPVIPFCFKKFRLPQ